MTAILSLLLCLGLWPCSAQAQRVASAPVNLQAPTARGLVAWWRDVPGATGGRFLYDLMGGPPLALTNMGTAGTTSGWATTTRPGSAFEVRFDGIDDNLSTPANSARMSPYFSMLLWIKLTANAPSDYALLWEAISGGASLFVNNTNRLATYVGGSAIDPSATTLSLQTWYHIALVSTTSQVQVYVNCRLDATTTGAGALSASAFYHIFGNKPTPASRFTGAMQDMKFYNRSLAASEVCTVMRESARGEPTLLRPPLLALGLSPELAPSGALGNFFRFFGQP